MDALLAGVARWQLVPLVLAALVLLARAKFLRRRWWRALAAVAAGGLALASAVALWAIPALRLPPPTGPDAVGTTVVQLTDLTRDEGATPAPDDRRVIVTQLWYPARPGTGTHRAHYLGRDAAEARVVAQGLADTFGVPSFQLDEVRRGRANARWNATPAGGRERWPVVLFSPGLGGVRTQNTAWAEDLASHGYAVIALDHPHDSAVVVLDDGTAVPSSVRSTGDDREDDRRADGWTSVRADDLRFVQSAVAAGSSPFPASLAARLDGDRIAVAGHSLGGAAAIQAAIDEPSLAAAIDIDGFPRNLGAGRLSVPLLVVVAGRGTGDPGGDRDYEAERRRLFERSTTAFELTIPGAAHLSFTDAGLFLPPVPALVGSGGRPRGARVTADATRAFLDVVLAGGDPSAMEGELRRVGRLRTWP